jgi:hypothetical protein
MVNDHALCYLHYSLLFKKIFQGDTRLQTWAARQIKVPFSKGFPDIGSFHPLYDPWESWLVFLSFYREGGRLSETVHPNSRRWGPHVKEAVSWKASVLGWQALCPGVRSPAQLCDTEQASSLH